MIVTVKTLSGKVYQKFKVTEKSTTYSDLLEKIKYEKRLPKITFPLGGSLYVSYGPKFLNIVDISKRIRKKEILLGFCETKLFEVRGECPVEEMPKGITELKITMNYEHLLPKLPKTLTELEFGSDQPLPDLHEGLRILKTNSYYNRPFTKLPGTLVELSIYGDYKIRLPDLPEGLKKLSVRSRYKGPLPKLPKSLIILDVTTCKNLLPPLPEGLEVLNIGEYYHPFPDPLPKSLVELNIFFTRKKSKYPLPKSTDKLEVTVMNFWENK